MTTNIQKKSWEEFKALGILWWVNRTLHIFGWAIVLEFDDADKVVNAYPARTKFRGFDYDTEGEGFRNMSKYIADTATELSEEAHSSRNSGARRWTKCGAWASAWG